MYSERRHLHVLFDWTELERWDDVGGASEACRKWHDASRLMVRSAIVHSYNWKRQAALLAAVLRTDRVEVRSWVAADYAKALVWLREA